MTLAEAVHAQINEILEKAWPERCPSCEPIDPAKIKAYGLREGMFAECMTCRKKGTVVKIAHPFGDRWIIQPQ
jgi:hypothetical protein